MLASPAPRKRAFPVLIAFLFAAPVLAGCISATEDLDPARGMDRLAYVPVNEDALSEPSYGILEAVDTRIEASTDGISLFAEVVLPDGDGPWPTIVHSTPYKHLDKAVSTVSGDALVQKYVPRGYAVVLADVRGFGDSEGCVEVWGANEQQDQYDLVEWVAAQEWSDGKVGMIGASYPGTTPIEAAVMAPPHLVTIVTAAGLTDPYFDWHYGGVPTGEAGPVGSPAAYQAIGSVPPIEPTADPAAWMTTAANTGCGTAELMANAWQMDSVYSEFYKDRDLASRVKSINASVLYAQGFTDGNVKPSQLLRFFNEIDAPKKGFFGQWGHEFPEREDYGTFELAWFDHWLKGKDTNVMAGPTVEVLTNEDTWRADAAFPSALTTSTPLYLDASDMSLAFAPPASESDASFIADRRPRVLGEGYGAVEDAVRGYAADEERLVFASAPLTRDVYLSGVTYLDFHATLDAENAYLLAALYEVNGDERTRVVFGGLAAALRESFEEYTPVPAGEPVHYRLRFQPREYVVSEGSTLELELYTPDVLSATTTEAVDPVTVTVHTGPERGSLLDVPTLDGRPDSAFPWES